MISPIDRLVGLSGGKGRRRARRAFSLLELMLVLAVLVIIAALALPAFHAPLENQRLRKSGDRLRIEWARARILAMRSGQIQGFYYVLGGNQYWVEPLAQADDVLQASLDVRTGRQTGQSAKSAEPVNDNRLAVGVAGAAELPENVMFVSGGTSGDLRSAAALQENASLPGAARQSANQSSLGSVAPPILFYPDGTSATARLVLGNTRNHFVVVQLRGLTGVARSSDLLTSDELPP